MKIVSTNLFGKGGMLGLAIYPYIFLNRHRIPTLPVLKFRKIINHEKIHHEQQLELLLVFFYLLYFLNLLINLLVYRNLRRAYEEICFEREAYIHDGNLNYLTIRKRYAFLKYVFKGYDR